MEHAAKALDIAITSLTVMQGMAPILRAATTKDEMRQILEAMQDELRAGSEEIDKICQECKQQTEEE